MKKHDWTNLKKDSIDYHLRQYLEPYDSTIQFYNFFKSKLSNSTNILDVAGGAGAASAYFLRQSNKGYYTVLDISDELISLGKKKACEFKIQNLKFICGDVRKHSFSAGEYDTVICLQTLSWLNDYQSFLEPILRDLSPKCIGITSLFYEGDISAYISIKEHKIGRSSEYNVYSMPTFGLYLKKYGYKIDALEPFNIKVDIEKPNNRDFMRTYTVKTNVGDQRLQVSGPIMLPWYMLSISKIKKNGD